MINEKKFDESKEFYLHGKQPTGEIYTKTQFARLVRYKIGYAIYARKRRILADKKYKKKIAKQLKRLERLEKDNRN